MATPFYNNMVKALRLLYPNWDQLSAEEQQAKFFQLDVGGMALAEAGLVVPAETAKSEYTTLWEVLEHIDGTLDLAELMGEEFAERVDKALWPPNGSSNYVEGGDDVEPIHE